MVGSQHDISVHCLPGVGTGDVAGAGAGGLAVNRVAEAVGHVAAEISPRWSSD